MSEETPSGEAPAEVPAEEQPKEEIKEATEAIVDVIGIKTEEIAQPEAEAEKTEEKPEEQPKEEIKEAATSLINAFGIKADENPQAEPVAEKTEEVPADEQPKEEIKEATTSIINALGIKADENPQAEPEAEKTEEKHEDLALSDNIIQVADRLVEEEFENKHETENTEQTEEPDTTNKETQETEENAPQKIEVNENNGEESKIESNQDEQNQENTEQNDVPVVETNAEDGTKLSIFEETPHFEDEGNQEPPSSPTPPPKKSQNTARSPRPKPKYVPAPRYVPDPNFDEKTLDKYALEAAKCKAPPLEATQPTLKYANHRVEECVNAQDYDKATLYESAIEYLHTICDRSAYEEAIQREKQENQDRLNNAKETVEKLTQKWDENMKQQKENHEKLLEALKQRNQQELDEFEQKWQSDEFLAQYNKPSARLLSMRSIEQTFAAAKLFDRAKEAKKQADELQKVETEEQRRRAMDDMKTQYEIIISRHENALDCFAQWSERERTNMELKRDKELYGWRMLIKRMEGPAGQNSKIKPFQETQVLGSRPLKKSNTKNAPAFSIGTLTLKNIIKSPKVTSPRKK